jgi:hypothetical protein
MAGDYATLLRAFGTACGCCEGHPGWNPRSDSSKRVEGGCFLFMDVFKPLPYLTGLLNRMVIKAITASPFIRAVTKNREVLERPSSLLWN